MQRTLPLPPAPPARPLAAAGEPPLRDLTIEELIDLEQQAEFFIVLGQDDAAIDLLVEPRAQHRRQQPAAVSEAAGDLSAPGRPRGPTSAPAAASNQRFNAYAADWGTSLQQGRSLEDYPGVLPRLVQVWPRPLDAMASLEALLFRKSRGELFELPGLPRGAGSCTRWRATCWTAKPSTPATSTCCCRWPTVANSA